jgi:hypothetical protein
MQSSIPAAKHSSRSPCIALAVIATIRGRRSPGQRRPISREASNPSISGTFRAGGVCSDSSLTTSAASLLEIAQHRHGDREDLGLALELRREFREIVVIFFLNHPAIGGATAGPGRAPG